MKLTHYPVPLLLDIAAPPGQGGAIVQGQQNGNGEPRSSVSHDASLRSLLVGDGPHDDGRVTWLGSILPGSRLAAPRAALREAQQGDWEERQRPARARLEALTPTHVELFQRPSVRPSAARCSLFVETR